MSHSQQQPGTSPRTLSIGGATFDLFIKADESAIHDCNGKKGFLLPLGGKIAIHDVNGACGGGAHNTAVGLSRLGCNAAFSGVLGEDQWGEAIRKNMEREGVNTSFLSIIEHEASSFSLILMSESGERTILTHKSMDRHFHDVTFDREAALNADVIYLNHIHKDTCVIEDDILKILTQSNAKHLTWNPGGRQIDAGMTDGNNAALVGQTDLLLLNKEEALTFSGKKTVLEALHALCTAGAKVVCVTDGPRGATAHDGKNIYHCPALEAKVVDMTGAGDSFGTAMTWALATGKDLPTALKAGTINAMSVVGSIGAQTGLLTEAQIQTQLTATDLSVSMESF